MANFMLTCFIKRFFLKKKRDGKNYPIHDRKLMGRKKKWGECLENKEMSEKSKMLMAETNIQ